MLLDGYLIPHLHDFPLRLQNVSKIDLTQVCYQIPVASDDISKAAIIALFRLFEFL